MAAESGGTEVLGKTTSTLQSGVTVGTDKITGTLIENDGWTSGPLKGPGYYLVLKFSASDWSKYTRVMVGLDPSVETGLVDVKNDTEHNGVFKITNKATQKFVITAYDGATSVTKLYDLSELTLQE